MENRSFINFLWLFAAMGLSLISCAVTPAASGASAPAQLSTNLQTNINPPFDFPGDASGHFDMSHLTVFGFSHNNPEDSDPQVYNSLVPDISTRAWLAGWSANEGPSQYNMSFLQNCRSKNIVFMGGITGSAVFRVDASSESEFLDWITRDAQNNPVNHTEIYNGYYQGSLANPNYRTHLLNKMKMQLDLGVDGLTIDETDGNGYSGGIKWGWNGNEAYDDYFISDFNRYLMDKYPNYSQMDWANHFGMTVDNIIRCDLPYNDLSRNFNYRKYLKTKGFDSNPHSPANPLAAEWGSVTSSRVPLIDNCFLEKAIRLYLKDEIMQLRAYARDKYSKEILITGNGIYPYMDYNSLGMFDYNHDDHGSNADYVPQTGSGHLDASKSLKPVFLQIRARSLASSGNVPLMVFIDWPGRTINAYLSFSLQEKKDLWQIYLPEAYACGMFYAFHLKTSDTTEATATQSGVLDFMTNYAQFYKINSGLFHGVSDTGLEPDVSMPQITATMLDQASENRFLVHLINHNYNLGIQPQKDLSVNFPMSAKPNAVTLISPDLAADQTLTYTYSNGQVTVSVPSLTYYDLLIVEK